MKRLAAKVGEYQKDGQTKGEYVKIGIIGESQNGEYILLDPTVNLAGVLTKQNMFNHWQKRKPSTSVMVSIFSDDYQGGNNSGQQSNQQQPASDDIPF